MVYLHMDSIDFDPIPLLCSLLADLDDGIVHWETKIWKDGYQSMERVEQTEFDDDALEMLFAPDSYVDAFFSLDTFDYKKKAGIRLVAKKLFIHPT